MFNLGIDLSDLQRESDELLSSMEVKVDELASKIPQVNVKDYIDQLTEDFTEMTFMPLDDVWERELGDLFNNENEDKE